MASDLSVFIDDIRLNIRVGVVMRHGDDVVLEFSNTAKHVVIPGGRMKIGEPSNLAIVREVEEEMGIKQTLALHFYSSRSYLARYRTYEVRYSFNSPPLPCNRKHVCGIELLLSE